MRREGTFFLADEFIHNKTEATEQIVSPGALQTQTIPFFSDCLCVTVRNSLSSRRRVNCHSSFWTRRPKNLIGTQYPSNTFWKKTGDRREVTSVKKSCGKTGRLKEYFIKKTGRWDEMKRMDQNFPFFFVAPIVSKRSSPSFS